MAFLFFSYFLGGRDVCRCCVCRENMRDEWEGGGESREGRAASLSLLPSLGAGGMGWYSSGPSAGQSPCCGAAEMILFRLRAAK